MSDLLQELTQLERLAEKLLAEVELLRDVKRELTEENARLRQDLQHAETAGQEREAERSAVATRVEKLSRGLGELLATAEAP